MIQSIIKYFHKVVNTFLQTRGLVLSSSKDWIDDVEDFSNLRKNVIPYTMTSKYRGYSAYQAMKYVIDGNIPGDIVECGVRRGGSTMLMMGAIKVNDRQPIFRLYDTYEGMSEPTDKDIAAFNGKKAIDYLHEQDKTKNPEGIGCYASLQDVKKNISTMYDLNKCFFIEGKVEDTIPGHIPDKIALLRLDTDFYESTYHEMLHLFPKLVSGGIIIIDDYGFRKGSKEAVDRYLRENNITILLNRIDDTGVIGIKM